LAVHQVVLGLEADLQGSAAEDTFAPRKFAKSVVGNPARPRRLRHEQRADLPDGRFLPMAAAASETRRHQRDRRAHLGWTLGGGVEVGLTPTGPPRRNIFTSGSTTAAMCSPLNNGFSSNVFRLGVNYRF